MIIDPMGVKNYGIVEYNDSAITDIIDELIDRKPELILGKKNLLTLHGELQKIMIEKRIKGVPIQAILDNIEGYGRLEVLLKDQYITDIVINSPSNVKIKRFGKWYDTSIKFSNVSELNEYVKRVAILNGSKIDQNSAEVTCTDRERGLRIVAGLQPLFVESPILSFRKPAANQSLEDLVAQDMLTEEEALELREAVKQRKSIITCGQGGSGKTTLLGALIKEIPLEERFLLAQESYEIKCTHPNSVSQLVRDTDNKNRKRYDLFDIIRYGLLLSLDRILVGEVKGKEAFDFIDAIFTGHRGGMTSIHTNCAEDAEERLIMLMQRADQKLSEEYLRKLLISSMDIVVFLDGFKVRKIRRVYQERKMVCCA